MTFTIYLLERHNNDLLGREIDCLRAVIKRVYKLHPITIEAWAVLTEHRHCSRTLPAGDSDFIMWWRLVKTLLSCGLAKIERRSAVRQAAGERGIWQRHYWEHLVREEADYQHHIDYIHVNPLKHSLGKRVVDW